MTVVSVRLRAQCRRRWRRGRNDPGHAVDDEQAARERLRQMLGPNSRPRKSWARRPMANRPSRGSSICGADLVLLGHPDARLHWFEVAACLPTPRPKLSSSPRSINTPSMRSSCTQSTTPEARQSRRLRAPSTASARAMVSKPVAKVEREFSSRVARQEHSSAGSLGRWVSGHPASLRWCTFSPTLGLTKHAPGDRTYLLDPTLKRSGATSGPRSVLPR